MTASPFLHLVLVGMVALSLAGCGRKGALDPPPGSSSQQGVPQMQSESRRGPAAAVDPIVPANQAQPGQGGLTEDEFGNPIVSQGRKRPFPLDAILN